MSKPRKTVLATRASGYHAVAQALGDEHIGLEARAHVDDHIDVKIWLRLLACSTQIEQQIRQRLRTRFNTTLPRFDYLAQLDRYPDGMRMNVLSRYLMVTGGNVTGLTDQLEKEGLVKREPDPDDRRSFRVSLTEAGRRNFAEMAAEHERWLIEMFDGLGASNKDALYAQLGRLRMHLAEREAELDAREDQP
ncbi:winged helix DNA-binding domain protein [Ralstonia insidiosa]|uniref:Winged helix DNA-binding domain protein n=1 Tax=Ralstonia insidiosa TaxID=190721 RepID=A0AAC9BM38_9RALS|nr:MULTISPECIES: MarR family transcriptional regulator [Ralstonia]ANH76906.1 winged helix DNA-binding domain protein [Ralstonia insidiosa]EPX99559.1 MarR family transcriptional regulator [Ralstonia sp. AU12-08]MBY4705106.1 MarR family transcriptional regulator [Ralstonia insidiosa]GAQ29234.1 marR family transcriptional regulator [Ralstonia sp. NT80]